MQEERKMMIMIMMTMNNKWWVIVNGKSTGDGMLHSSERREGRQRLHTINIMS